MILFSLVYFNVIVLAADLRGNGLLIISQFDTKAPHNSDLYRSTEHIN